MARPIEVPVVVKKGSLSRSIEGEATAAMHKLGRSSGAVAPLGRMLGKIRADADEFTKSIEASNARVIAFGASVGVINGISNAFKSLIATTVKVEKSMADINIVLGASQSNLAKFGDGLFKVAKNTAQSFDVVAEAATEFARQGLSIEETLKRTNDALILTRLTGLKAAESVKGLTAAVNGFGKAGLTTTQIINKLSAVDVKFAVGTDDLIDALSRAGAVAQDAGVSFDELVALVTVAQQRTARGGAVIGNAFKTIYTRIQDPKALNALRSVKIAVDDVAGAALPANRVLQNLAQSYDGLNRSQKATVDQFVAGKFQINILKSVLGDLSTVNNEYNRAQQVSANATDQAIQKNEQLNKTLAALATQGGVAIEELAKKVGDISLGPGMRNIITTFNELVEGMTRGLDGEGTGATFAKGLLRGVGGILTGPGLVLVGGVFIKLFKDLTVFGVKSLKNLLGLNNASKQQAALQQGIGQLLATNLKFQQAIAAAEGNTAKQAAITSRFLAQEVAMRERAAAATSRMAAGAYAGGFGVSSAGVITRGARRRGAPSFAPTGGIPNFASITDYIQDGVFNVGQMPEVMTGSTTQYGTKTDNKIPIDAFFRESKLQHTSGKKKGQFTSAGAELRRALDAHGVTHVQGHVRAMNLPFSDTKGALSFYDQAFNVGPAREIGIHSDVRTRQTKSLADVGRQMMIDNPKKYGMSPTDAFMDAVRQHRPSILASGMSDFQLRSFYTGSGGSFERAMFAADSNLKPYGHANFMFDAARDVGGGKFRQMDVKSRLNRTQFASLLAKKMRTMDLDEVPLMNIEGDRKHFQGQALKPGTFEARMSARPGFKFGRFIRNFAPLGDAIQREKMQVGAMMGISPSSVQTRVVQNTALKSPFNPQGFGVISPTVGQHSFADAKRMHRGEDLRTTNLPNFSIGGGGSRMDPFTGEMTHASVVDPAATGPLKVSVEDYSDKALKKSEGALERRSRLERGASFAGMAGKAGDVAFGVPMKERIMRKTAPLIAGAKGVGAAAMGPGFTGMFAAEMAGGFLPAYGGAGLEGILGMTPEQRQASGRTRGGVMGGIYGATAGMTLGSALKQMGKKAHPLLTVGSTVLGAGIGYARGGERNLTPDQLMGAAGLQQEKLDKDIQNINLIRQGLSSIGGMSPDQRTETLNRMQTLLTQISDPTARQQLSEALMTTPGRGLAGIDETVTGLMQRRGGASANFEARAGIGRAGQVKGFSKTSVQATAKALKEAGLDVDHIRMLQGFGQAGIDATSGVIGTAANVADEAFRLIGGDSIIGKQITNAMMDTDLPDKLNLAEGELEGFAESLVRIQEGEGFEGLITAFLNLKENSDKLSTDLKTASFRMQNVYQDFEDIYSGMRGRARAAQLDAALFPFGERTQGAIDSQALSIQGRRFGARNTINMRYNQGIDAADRNLRFERGQMMAQAGVGLSGINISRTPGANLALMRQIEKNLQGGNVSGMTRMLEAAQESKTYGGQTLQIGVEEMQSLIDWSRTLENSSEILNKTTQAQKDYLEVTKKLAEDLEKGGVVNSAIEGFRTSLKDAMMNIADPSMGGGDIARNFAIGILRSIQNEASGRFADNFTNMLFGKKQKGGVIKAQNGMYISGSRTGDKNPALLEDGEYVLNRNAVQAMGGPRALDSLNFSMAPRFQGGGIMSGLGSIVTAPFKLIGSLFKAIFGGGGGGASKPSVADQQLAQTNQILAEIDAISGGGGAGLGGVPADSPRMAGIRKRASHSSLLKRLKDYKRLRPGPLGHSGQMIDGAFHPGRTYGLTNQAASKKLTNLMHKGAKVGGPEALMPMIEELGRNPGMFDGFTLGGVKFGPDQSIIRKIAALQQMMEDRGIGGFYQSGGGVFGGVPSKHRRRAMVRFGYGSMIPGYQGGTLGGGGVGPRLDIFDARLSSKAHANDPTSQAIRGYFRQQRQKDIQKKFARQAKRDQLTQAVVSTAISSTLMDATQGFQGIKGIAGRIKGMFSGGGGEGGQQDDLNAAELEYLTNITGTDSPLSNPRGAIVKPMRLDQMRGPMDITTATGPRYRPLNARVGPIQKQVGPGVYIDDVATRPAVPGSGLVGGRFRPSGPQNVGRFVDSTDFPTPGRAPSGPPSERSADMRFLWKQSSRLMERIGKLTEEMEKRKQLEEQRGQRQLYNNPFIDGFFRGKQRGGSIDNIPAMLTGGEFVVNAGAVKRYGSNTLQHMNRGGMVGNQKFVPAGQNGSAKSSGEASTSNNNNTVNISVNMGANGSPAISEDASGTSQDGARGGRELGRKIRNAVLSVIEEEKRVGGKLRNPYAREQ